MCGVAATGKSFVHGALYEQGEREDEEDRPWRHYITTPKENQIRWPEQEQEAVL